MTAQPQPNAPPNRILAADPPPVSGEDLSNLAAQIGYELLATLRELRIMLAVKNFTRPSNPPAAYGRPPIHGDAPDDEGGPQ